MEYIDINALVTTWQSLILAISTGQFSPDKVRAVLNNIIDEICEHKELIINGTLSEANMTLLFVNVVQYGKNYGANTFKLAFLSII